MNGIDYAEVVLAERWQALADKLHAEKAAAAVAERITPADLPADTFYRSHKLVGQVLGGGCNNSAAHHLQRLADGADRDSVRRAVTYQLCRSYEIRTHSALANLQPHVGEQAVGIVADSMIAAMEDY